MLAVADAPPDLQPDPGQRPELPRLPQRQPQDPGRLGVGGPVARAEGGV